LALPTGPKCIRRLEIGRKTGFSAWMSRLSQPRNSVNSPLAAWLGMPVTGQSTKRAPCAFTALASFLIQPCDRVEHSIAQARFATLAFVAPWRPSQTSREALSSASIAKITEAPSAASRGVTANVAPSFTSGRAFAAVRL
jgi:hypothetical protein